MKDCFGDSRLRSGITATNALVGLMVALVVAVAVTVTAIAVRRTYRGQPSPYKYDLTDYRKTDPKFIICEEIGPAFTTGFEHSRAIAIGPEGKIHVTGDRAVRLFDGSGQRVGQVEMAGRPGALAVDGDGSIYVGIGPADEDRWDHVEVYAADGRRKARWRSPGPKAFLTSIAVTEEDVLVADAGGRIVLRYDKSGKLINRIGKKDEDRGVPGFVLRSPYFDLAVAPDGLLRVANTGYHRIETYTLDGEWGRHWGKYSSRPEGFCGCCNPANFALLPADGKGAGSFGGFVTAEKALTRVKIYDAAGGFVGVVAGPERFKKHDQLAAGKPAGVPFRALDVAVAADGRVLVLDPYTNEVRAFKRLEKDAVRARSET